MTIIELLVSHPDTVVYLRGSLAVTFGFAPRVLKDEGLQRLAGSLALTAHG